MDQEIEFSKRFEKEDGVITHNAYEIYLEGAKKLWVKYSSKYDLRPQRDASRGKNRGIKFYEDTTSRSCIIYISIGQTATIYVLDDRIRTLLDLDYEQDNRGNYRCTMPDTDTIMQAIDGII